MTAVLAVDAESYPVVDVNKYWRQALNGKPASPCLVDGDDIYPQKHCIIWEDTAITTSITSENIQFDARTTVSCGRWFDVSPFDHLKGVQMRERLPQFRFEKGAPSNAQSRGAHGHHTNSRRSKFAYSNLDPSMRMSAHPSRGTQDHPEHTDENERDMSQAYAESMLRLLRKDSTNPDVLYDVGKMCSYHSHTFLAVECLRKCLYYDDKHVDAMIQLARIMRRSGYREDCVSILECAIQVEKKIDVRVYILLAETLIELDRQAEAVDLLKRTQDSIKEARPILLRNVLPMLAKYITFSGVGVFVVICAGVFFSRRCMSRIKDTERTAKAVKKAIKRSQSQSTL
eukprot:CFRG3254T1